MKPTEPRPPSNDRVGLSFFSNLYNEAFVANSRRPPSNSICVSSDDESIQFPSHAINDPLQRNTPTSTLATPRNLTSMDSRGGRQSEGPSKANGPRMNTLPVSISERRETSYSANSIDPWPKPQIINDRRTSWGSTVPASGQRIVDAEKSAMQEELDRLKRILELKSLIESQKDEDIAALQHDLDRAQSASLKNDQKSREGSDKGWDLTSLLRDGLTGRRIFGNSQNSASVRVGVASPSGGDRDSLSDQLRDVLTERTKQVLDLQRQLEDMDNYLNNERNSFQKEVNSRNKKIATLTTEIEREREVSRALAQERQDAHDQLTQSRVEIGNRDNWIRDLTARLTRREAELKRCELAAEQRTIEYMNVHEKLDRLQARLDEYAHYFYVFNCLEVSPTDGGQSPVTLTLYKTLHSGAYFMELSRWDRTDHLEFSRILTAEYVILEKVDEYHLTTVRITFPGKIKQWFTQSLKSYSRSTPQTLSSACRRENNGHIQSKLLRLETTGGDLLLNLLTEQKVDECFRAIRYFIKMSRESHQARIQAKGIEILCETEAFIIGKSFAGHPLAVCHAGTGLINSFQPTEYSMHPQRVTVPAEVVAEQQQVAQTREILDACVRTVNGTNCDHRTTKNGRDMDAPAVSEECIRRLDLRTNV